MPVFGVVYRGRHRRRTNRICGTRDADAGRDGHRLGQCGFIRMDTTYCTQEIFAYKLKDSSPRVGIKRGQALE